MSFEQLHITIVLVSQFKMGRIACDRHVGETKKDD
jgi:hypothetical protein